MEQFGILIIGAGPIVIGQACEFDYSGAQACKALREEGYRVILVNSNPATIMTDPEMADATYVEPITPEIVAKIIEKERNVLPGGFALLPTMGGQTALNTALSLKRMGVLERYNVEILVQDSQSDSNRSAEVSGDLILNEEVNLLIPASTTPTITAAADQAELYEIPCVSCGAPWQAIIFPRGGADNPFTWTYHFFWGLDEALRTFVGLWNTIETNKKVGMLFPQNIDGETWGNEDYGLPSPTREAGFEVIKPGYFQPRTNDFTAQISTFKNEGCDIVGGIAFTDDFKTFVNQCNQQGYHPRAMTMAAALLFPSAVEAMGDLQSLDGVIGAKQARP